MNIADPHPRIEPSRADLRRRLGATALVLGTLQFFVVHLIVQSAWPTPYSWSRNFVSDLGAVSCGPFLGVDVCSPLHAGMNTAFVAQGVFLIAGVLLIGRRGVLTSRAVRALVVLAGIGWIVVGFVPEDVNLAVHSIGALPVFVLGNIALILAGRARGGLRPMRRASGVLGALGVLGLVATAVAVARPEWGVVGAAERLALFPLQVWALLVGLHVLRSGGARPS